jgi:hypothetical protein
MSTTLARCAASATSSPQKVDGFTGYRLTQIVRPVRCEQCATEAQIPAKIVRQLVVSSDGVIQTQSIVPAQARSTGARPDKHSATIRILTDTLGFNEHVFHFQTYRGGRCR